MSEINGNKNTNTNGNGKNGKDKKDVDNSFEKNFDVYMYGCLNFDRESNDKAMLDIARRLNTEVETRHVDIDEPSELKIVYSLKNDGEMIYHKESERDVIEVEIASPEPKPQDNFFFILHNFKPQKKSRAFYYHDSEEVACLPRYIAHSPADLEINYVKEIALGYDFRTFGFNQSSIGVIKFDKKDGLEKKVEESK